MQNYHEFLDEILIPEDKLQKGSPSWQLRFPETIRPGFAACLHLKRRGRLSWWI
jgi:hypothetical protein